jgi:hypothetical protein
MLVYVYRCPRDATGRFMHAKNPTIDTVSKNLMYYTIGNDAQEPDAAYFNMKTITAFTHSIHENELILRLLTQPAKMADATG